MTAVDLPTVPEVSPNGTSSVRPLDASESVAPAVGASIARVLSQSERLVAWSLGLMVAALGVIGFVNSFHEVAAAVEPSFGGLAWSAPIGIDLGIAVFTGLDLFLARLGMRLSWLRLVPWSLVGVTIALNVAQPLGRGDVIGAGAHGVLPLLWVIAVEIAAHVMRQWARRGQTGQERRAAGRMDRVRTSRWLLAPVSTLRIRRLMILWEERSYQAALDRWQARRRARGHMARRHGLIKWHWKAPIDQRLDYRYAQLTLAKDGQDAVGADDAPPTSSDRGSRDPGGGSPRRRQGAAPKRTGRTNDTAQVDVSDLLPVGRTVAEELAGEDVKLTRGTLRERFRAHGQTLSNAKAGPLIRELHDEGYA